MKNQKGQAMIEYGIIIALVAIMGIAAMQMMGNSVASVFESLNFDNTANRISGGDSTFGGVGVGGDPTQQSFGNSTLGGFGGALYAGD